MSIELSGDAITGCPNVAGAWVNFNGTGTVAIKGDYNVDSITDNGTGDFTINFTTNFKNANYAIAGHKSFDGTYGCCVISSAVSATKTVSACKVDTTVQTGGRTDSADNSVIFLGELA